MTQDHNFEPARFLEELVSTGVLNAPAAQRAADASGQTSTSVEKTLLEIGLVAEETLFRALATHLGLPFAEHDKIRPDLCQDIALAPEFLRRAGIVPVAIDDSVTIAVCEPDCGDLLASIAFKLKCPVRVEIATPSAIKAALTSLPGGEPEKNTGEASDSDIARLTSLANDGPVVRLVNDHIAEAATRRASDIHFEATENGMRVRYRIDGTLHLIRTLSNTEKAGVTSRLKIMADLNISERRRPQDGRARLSVRGRDIDLRLSTLPTQFGESTVLRLLDQSRVDLSWSALGFTADQAREIERVATAPNGIFLVAGPTGSGKTTTLYTLLNRLRSDERKIITVEDPIEFSIPGINQVQVEPEIDMSFARALRAILRQDPDVVLVGEIRDPETAEIATRAALVGRLVLSTIHTNDSVSAISRLKDLGVAPYLIGATLRGVLSQRLVRRLCDDCKGAGCGACNQTGYAGRTVISELLKNTPTLAEAITQHSDPAELARIAKAGGMTTLAENADELVQGMRVAELDVVRVTVRDE